VNVRTSRLSFLIFIFFAAILFVRASYADSVTNSDDNIITGSTRQDIEVAKFRSGTSQKGQTPEFGFCYEFEKMYYWGATYIQRDLKGAKWPVPLTIMGENITPEKWIDIDSCARTMMAEIGTEPACRGPNNDGYATALARIIANRAKNVLDRAPYLPQDDYEDAVHFPTKKAVEDKNQFSVWNESAKVRAGTACPSRTGPNAPVWQNMLNLCKTVVLKDEGGQRIRKRTPEMTDDMRSYTSNCRMHYVRLCEGYEKMKIEVEATPITNYRCFELWQPGKNGTHDRPSQEQACMTQAKTCCTGPTPMPIPATKDQPVTFRMVDTDSFIPEKKDACERQAPSWLRTQTASK
jgi:hypothetical protein